MGKVYSPTKTHGGKFYLAREIVALFPTNYLTYVEPFAGGLSVLFEHNPENKSEIVNDLNGELTNFWLTLQDEVAFQKFKRIVECVPFSEVEYKKATYIKIDWAPKPSPDVESAVTFFIKARQSLAGRQKSFTPISRSRTRRNMNEQVSAWLSAVEGLEAVHTRLKRVLILNRPALEVIHMMDHPDTLYYTDSPYLHETRASTDDYGDFEMSDQDHLDLLLALSSIKGKFALSGYPSKMYEEWAALHNFKCHVFDIPNSAAGGKTKRVMQECVWTNY